mgnify:CR=1 FL=1
MPTTYAHYRLGENTRALLPDKLQKVIQQNIGLFHIGVHGPDPLFYYNPVHIFSLKFHHYVFVHVYHQLDLHKYEHP